MHLLPSDHLDQFRLIPTQSLPVGRHLPKFCCFNLIKSVILRLTAMLRPSSMTEAMVVCRPQPSCGLFVYASLRSHVVSPALTSSPLFWAQFAPWTCHRRGDLIRTCVIVPRRLVVDLVTLIDVYVYSLALWTPSV